ncbi:MAG: Rpp14/Pop5 family protein [Candidatus Lokiarchaeota archaeon]|nr:Rpp14/Pop5 family protein [Candidatus Lokiarchaeota archaeon]
MHLQRQRYILFEFITFNSDLHINEKDVIRTIWTTLLTLFGEYQAYKTGLWMIEFNPLEQYGIIRCNNITKDKIIATLAFIHKVKSYPIIFHSIKTAGTIKKIKQTQKEFFATHRKTPIRM